MALDYQQILDMPMLSAGDIGEDMKLIRVPGGWIFRFQEGISIAAVFVPEPKEANDDGE